MASSCARLDNLLSQPPWLLLLLALSLLSFLSLRFLHVTFLHPPNPSAAATAHGRRHRFHQRRRQALRLPARPPGPQPRPFRPQSLQAPLRRRRDPIQIPQIGDQYRRHRFLRRSRRRSRNPKKYHPDLDAGILVNRAGVSYPYARFFHEVDDELIRDLIKVNVEGSRTVERKRGAVVNIGSGAAIVFPSDPLYKVYAATKA